MNSRRPVNSDVVRLPMQSRTLATIVFLVTSTTIGGHFQDNPGIRDCPYVSVSCPDAVDAKSDLHAAANFTGSPSSRIKYYWTVTWPSGGRKGRIKSGQGTPSLVVSVPRRTRGSLTVTVKVTGFDPACDKEVSCSTLLGRN
jgi:hypothetical protein